MSYKKIQVVTLSSDFARATEIVEAPLREPKDDEVLVKNHFSGINATDINISAGRYFTDGKVPYDVGFEGLGIVQSIGSKVNDSIADEKLKLKVGQPVLYLGSSGFAEYIYANAPQLIPVPELNPKYLSILVNGLTASIGLDKAGHIKAGEKVLITAAAGGTGQICVQWAKSKGCHVIGTTSSEEKANYLKSLGCDEIINYKEKNLSKELATLHPEGVDVIWETIGGQTFVDLVDNLAIHGRILVVGGITGYKETGFPKVSIPELPSKILHKSISVTGFLLTNEAQHFKEYVPQLILGIATDKIKIKIDMGENSPKGPFKGLKGAIDAVEHLHTGKSSGKVVAAIQ